MSRLPGGTEEPGTVQISVRSPDYRIFEVNGKTRAETGSVETVRRTNILLPTVQDWLRARATAVRRMPGLFRGLLSPKSGGGTCRKVDAGSNQA
jgi:hypothetical protein